MTDNMIDSWKTELKADARAGPLTKSDGLQMDTESDLLQEKEILIWEMASIEEEMVTAQAYFDERMDELRHEYDSAKVRLEQIEQQILTGR